MKPYAMKIDMTQAVPGSLWILRGDENDPHEVAKLLEDVDGEWFRMQVVQSSARMASCIEAACTHGTSWTRLSIRSALTRNRHD
jgi:hypothetical protein